MHVGITPPCISSINSRDEVHFGLYGEPEDYQKYVIDA
jgi:hypothetical protein